MALLTDIDDVKKRLGKLEEETRFKIKQMEESFALFRDVVIQMQKEKTELEKRNMLLEKEKKLLIEKQKNMISRPLTSAAGKIDERLIRPVKAEFDDTVNLFKEALREDEPNEKEEVSYIEIAEPAENQKATQKSAEKDAAAEDNNKKRIIRWLREKYGIDKKPEQPPIKEKKKKSRK